MLETGSSTGTDGFTAEEFATMARVLEGRHGDHAAEIAAFFALEHQLMGDRPRASAWASVASLLRTGSHGRRLNARYLRH